MTKTPRIRTPVKQHLNNFRMGILPFVCFFAFAGMTLWLWQRQVTRGNLVGELESVRIDVLTEAGGLLMAPGAKTTEGHNVLADSYVQLFQPVFKDQVIARIDDALLKAELATLQAEIKELNADMAASLSQVQVDLAQLGQNYDRDLVSRIVERERYKLQLSQLKSEIAVHKVEKKEIEDELDILNDANNRLGGSIRRREVTILEGRRDVVNESIITKTALLKEVEQLLAAAQKRVEELPEAPTLPEIETMRQTFEEAREVQETKLDEVLVQLEKLEIRSPINGVVTAIYQYPGNAVPAGTPIVAIAKDDAEFIVSYWREKHRARPLKGLPVTIRVRNQEFNTVIDSVGPTVELVPAHHLRDPSRPEWGIPVKFVKPKELQIRPGELVPVIFREARL
jgi:multidrug resistance efflux pump